MNEARPQILVTGATGRLGRAAVSHLQAAGLTVRALSRGRREPEDRLEWVVGDLSTGAGLREAAEGIDAIIHLASAPYQGRYTKEVELDGTRNLLRAAESAGVSRLIYTSIIGCDQIPWAYFQIKLATEQLVHASPINTTVVRLAQFHEFLDQAFTGMSRLGALISDRNVVAQPVDTDDIAPELLRVLLEEPSVERIEFAGPERLGLDQALTEWTEATNRRRRILHLRIPGKLGRAFRSGALTTRNGNRGLRTWKDYLEAKYNPRRE